MKIKSDAEAVREFTEGAAQDVPDFPRVMTKEEVFFLSKMMLDEASVLLLDFLTVVILKHRLWSFALRSLRQMKQNKN